MPDLERARGLLTQARQVMVLTGAGISAESGVPTFRGEGGLWKRHRAEELATPEAFARDPRLVWEWYAWRRSLIRECRPNAAHASLARWGLSHPALTIVTQNVDGLHEQAALDAAAGLEDPAIQAEPADRARDLTLGAEIVEIHGSIFRSRCTRCGTRAPHPGPVVADALDTLPRCEGCDGLLRPDVIWFGEALDERVLARAVEAASAAELCLVVGTSGIVHPAAGLPGITRAQGGVMIEVNPDPTPLTSLASLVIRGRAAEVLPQVLPS
jgi:NAD-dependent deacetylase